MNGGRAREIHVVVDVEKLNARGLSIDQVREAIQKENVEIPGGALEQGKWEVGLRTLGRIDAAVAVREHHHRHRQRRRRSESPTSATPRTPSSGRRRRCSLDDGRRRSSSTSGARPARTRSG